MKVGQIYWTPVTGWKDADIQNGEPSNANLVLVFGERALIQSSDSWLAELKRRYPQASIASCSTSGEILESRMLDHSIVATAIQFEKAEVRAECVDLQTVGGSLEAGRVLAARLDDPQLRLVFVLCDGGIGNGTELAQGFSETLKRNVPVTGGLAGDGPNFETTVVGLDKLPEPGFVVAIGLYGEHLEIGHGCQGGWDEFGPERVVTESIGSRLLALDGQSALGLYKSYLGEYSQGLPATALLFPLSVRANANDEKLLVRTILSIDEETQSLNFAGDIPVGYSARLMKANFDRLVDASETASNMSLSTLSAAKPQLAILISCVGRKFVLGARVEEEIEAARSVFGPKTVIAGFYSYGELSPIGSNGRCELHNQTMTITTISEP